MAIRAIRTAERPEEYHSGIPNRDLTEEEYLALTDDQRETVQNSALYELRANADVNAELRRERAETEKATPKPVAEDKSEGGD